MSVAVCYFCSNIQNICYICDVCLSFSVMASFLLIVKTSVFTGLYLGLWFELSVETNMGVGGQPRQHIPVVNLLHEGVSQNQDRAVCRNLG